MGIPYVLGVINLFFGVQSVGKPSDRAGFRLRYKKEAGMNIRTPLWRIQPRASWDDGKHRQALGYSDSGYFSEKWWIKIVQNRSKLINNGQVWWLSGGFNKTQARRNIMTGKKTAPRYEMTRRRDSTRETILPCPRCGKRLADLKGHRCAGDFEIELSCPGSCGLVWVKTQDIEKILAKGTNKA